MLPSHNRFKYSAIKQRPVFDWPGNKRLAVYIAVNIEHFPYGVQCGVDLDRRTEPWSQRSWLWREYGNRGFEVLAFPCNQFGAQEPGSADEIESFCKINFGLSFPLFAKIEVNGNGADPLYQWLKSAAPGLAGTKSIKWNFTKFLIGRDGKVVRRYAPLDKPAAIAKDIEKLL